LRIPASGCSLIGRKVSAAERRQRVYAALVGGISLVIGWLLSALPVPLIGHLAGR